MKIQKLMLELLSGLAFVAAVSIGCSEVGNFYVDAPADLQSKIDSIAAAKQAVDTGDTTYVDITTAVVGATDCTTAWWGDFSQSFEVPAGQLLHFEFVNHSSMNNNWSNWNVVCTTNGDRDASDYSEYFVIRSDAYGWGNGDYASALIATDYFEEGKLADWDEFRTNFMDGAYCTIEIDHAAAGVAYMTAYSYNATYGFGITETYSQAVSATSPVYVFITTDESSFNMQSAYCVPSKIQEIPDENAVSISAAGYPVSLEIGSEDYWGSAVATVTFADGTTAEAAVEDITFNVPDLGTLGTKTILYSYSKTKQGNYGPSVCGSYTIDVVNPIVAIEATAKAYLIGGAKYVTLSNGALHVEATYSDDSKALLSPSQYDVEFAGGKIVYEGVAGSYPDAFTVSVTTASGNLIQDSGTLEIIAGELPAQTEPVGAADFSNAWWTTFTQDWVVAPYTSASLSMHVTSLCGFNYQSPCTILRAASLAEYAVVRMDNFGWGGSGYDTAVLSSDWNWDTFLSGLNDSDVAITVSNNGDGTANVRYYVIYAGGETHFQYYDGVTVDPSDLQFALVTEESYLVFD